MIRYISTFLVLALLSGCAGTPSHQSAIRAAEVSFTTYESVSNAVVSETKRLVAINHTRSLTGAERAEVIGLNTLRDLLDRYSVAHNLYVKALKIGNSATIAEARTLVVDLWREVKDSAIQLKLNFNAVAP